MKEGGGAGLQVYCVEDNDSIRLGWFREGDRERSVRECFNKRSTQISRNYTGKGNRL